MPKTPRFHRHSRELYFLAGSLGLVHNMTPLVGYVCTIDVAAVDNSVAAALANGAST